MKRLGQAPDDSIIDITLRVIRELERDHPGQSTKVLFEDSANETAELQVFRNSPAKTADWTPDSWYQFGDVKVLRDGDKITLRAIGQTTVKKTKAPTKNGTTDSSNENTGETTTVLHLSDTHLGRQSYNSETRAQDFTDAFLEALQIAIQQDVDAVVHTGDVTHHDNPEDGLDEAAWNMLELLAKRDIPFFLIIGNHDLTENREPQRWIQTAVDRGLCYRLGREPKVVGNVALYGIDYHEPSWWRDQDSLSLAKPPEETKPVLCLHQSVAPLAPGDDLICLSDILEKSEITPESVLLGHSHYTQAATINEVLTFYAGSTERTNRGYRDEPTVVNEIYFGEHIDLTTHSLDTRAFSTYTLVDVGQDPTDLHKACERLNPDGEVVTAFVVGKGPEPRSVEQAFESAGALDAKCYEATAVPDLETGIYSGDPENLAADQISTQTGNINADRVQKNKPSLDSESDSQLSDKLPNTADEVRFMHIGSIHLGSANISTKRRQEFRDSLNEMAEIAKSHDVSAIVQTGTLFATRSPTDVDIAALRKTLETLAQEEIAFVHAGSERDHDMEIVDELDSENLLERPKQTPLQVADVAVYGIDPSSHQTVGDQLNGLAQPPKGAQKIAVIGAASVDPPVDNGDYDLQTLRNQCELDVDFYLFGGSQVHKKSRAHLDTGEQVHIAGPTEQIYRKSDLPTLPPYPCKASIIGTDGYYELDSFTHRPIILYEANCAADASLSDLLDKIETESSTLLIRLIGCYDPNRSFEKKELLKEVRELVGVARIWDDREQNPAELDRKHESIDLTVLDSFGGTEKVPSPRHKQEPKSDVETIQTTESKTDLEPSNELLDEFDVVTDDRHYDEPLRAGAGGKVNPKSHYSGADLERAGFATVTETNDGTCGYTLDLGRLSEHQRVTLDGDQWNCPHSASDGNRCPFHNHDADPDKVREKFLEQIQTNEPRAMEFVGATLPGVTLRNQRIGGNDYKPVDLRHANVTGTFELETCVVTTEFRVDGARFDDVFKIRGGKIRAGFSARETWFREDLRTAFTALETSIVLYGCLVDGVAKFNGTAFPDGMALTQTTFHEGLNLNRSRFGGQLYARKIDVGGPVSTIRTVFNQDLVLRQSSFRDDLTLQTARCDSFVELNGAVFDHYSTLVLDSAQINGELRIADAVLSSVSGENATIDGEVILHQTTAESIDFTEAVFNGGFSSTIKPNEGFESESDGEFLLRVSENLVMEAAELTTRSTLDCVVDGICDLSRIKLSAPFELNGTVGELDISESVCEASPIIGATVTGDFKATQIAVQNNISVVSDKIEGDLNLSKANIGNRLECTDSTINGDLILSYANIDDGVDCVGSRVRGTINITDAVVGRSLRIGYHKFYPKKDHTDQGRLTIGNIKLDRSEINSTIEIRGIKTNQCSFVEGSCNDLTLQSVQVNEVVLDSVRISRVLTCTDVQSDNLSVLKSYINRINCEVVGTDASELVVNMRQTTIDSGSISLGQGLVGYDFTGGKIGDVQLVPGDSGCSGSNFLDRFRFYRTDFERFHFDQFDGLVEADYEIHGFEFKLAGENPEQPTPAGLEATYRRAKIGADSVGNSDLEGEFYIKTAEYRKQQYRDNGDKSRYYWNRVFELTSGYGEKPIRVIISSAAIVAVFALLFPLIKLAETTYVSGSLSVAGNQLLEGTLLPSVYGYPWGWLLLSGESFTTIVLGGANVESVPLRLVSSIEGFVGAFMVSLFLYTLAKSIDR